MCASSIFFDLQMVGHPQRRLFDDCGNTCRTPPTLIKPAVLFQRHTLGRNCVAYSQTDSRCSTVPMSESLFGAPLRVCVSGCRSLLFQ